MRQRWIPAALGTLAVVASGLGVLPSAPVLTAHADSLTTDTFTDTGTCPTAMYTVPAGVVALDVTVIGQQGASGSSSSDHGGGDGGRGEIVSARLPVTPGQLLEVIVDDVFGGTSPGGNGNGGGGSGIFLTPANCNVGTPLVIAAGGGGGGSGDVAGPGGTGGDAGFSSGSPGNNAGSNEQEAGAGGGAGTLTAGGSGGRGGHGTTIFGTGGDGGPGQAFSAIRSGGGGGYTGGGTDGAGGSGGGGWFGGGGGGGSGGDGGGGGGGGSSFVDSSATDVTSSTAAAGTAPSITITPSLYTTTTGVVSSSLDPATTTSATYTAVIDVPYVTSPAGTVHFVATNGATTVDMGSATLTSVAGSRGTTSVKQALGAGVWSVTATYDGNAGSTAFGSVGYEGSTSNPFSQTVGTPPEVTLQPVNSITDLPGGGASFTAAASGDSAPTVHWQQSQDNGATWQDMLGSGNTSPTLTLLCTLCEGRYRAVFTNPLGSVTTESALAAVNHPPSIGTLADAAAPVGGNATFTALASAYPQPDARWQVSTDGGKTWSGPDPTRTTVVGSNTPPRSDEYSWQSSLTFNNVASADNGTEVRVTFSNTFDSTVHSATSNTATLRLAPSCIVSHPTPTNFSHCEFANLAGLNLPNIDFSYGDYAHATFFGDTLDSSTFQTANLSGTVFGNVSLVNTFFDSVNLTGAYLVGDDFSRAVPFRFSGVTGTILVPSDTTVYATGSSATVTWPTPPTLGLPAFDCNPASGSSFPLDTTAGGTTVTCTNPNFVRGTFTVHVLPAVAPQVTQQPVDATLFWQPGGYATTFTAAASGTPAPTVQWQVSVDGGKTFTDIAGATFDELLVTNPPFSATGNQYQAVFTNMAGTATSNPATLHVGPQPIGVAVAGSQTFGDLLPTLTPTFIAPDGETLQGAVACADVFGQVGAGDTAITASLAPGTYLIDPSSCSGLTPAPDSTDYAVQYQPGRFVVSPVTITVNVSGTLTPGTGPVFTETDDGPTGVLPSATSLTCSTVDGGTGITAKPGTYTLDGSSCTYNPPFSNPDYTVRFVGVTGGFVVTSPTVHVAVAGGEQYGATPSFSDAGDDAGLSGVTLSGVLTCAPPSGPSPLPVGTYTVSGATCFGLTASPPAQIDYVDGPFTVAPAPLQVVADDKTMMYGGPMPTFTNTAHGLVTGDPQSVVTGVTCTSTAGPSPTVGHYTISCGGGSASNYTLSYSPGTLTVTTVQLTVTPNNAAMTYGGPLPAMGATLTGAVNGDTFTSLGGTCSTSALATSPVGAYSIGCTVTAPNYTVTYNSGTLTVSRAPLSVSAKSKTMTYGGTVPSFDATVVGLVNGDTFTSLGGACSDSAASATLGAGTYPGAITCSGVDPTNYTVTYNPGALTVAPASLTVAANNAEMTYGGPLPAMGAMLTGAVNGDTFLSLGGSCTTTAVVSSPVGAYPITCTVVAPNYTVTYKGGTLTVSREPLTVTAGSKSMTYGGTLPSFDAAVSGLVNGNTFAGLGGTCTSSIASATLGAGTYPGAITCSGVSPANYDVTYNPGTLTVNPALLTVTADDKSMTYGFPVPSLTDTITGFANGQSLSTSGVSGAASCATTGTATSPAQSYPITCTVGTLSAPNYSFPTGNFVAGTLHITKHAATVGYSGVQFLSTGSSSVTTANVTLQATVTPASGGTVDVTRAGVVFDIYASTNWNMTSPDATCTASSVTSGGVATCNASLGVDNWTVVPTIPATNQFFTAANGDPTVVSVYQPTTGTWVTGGGWVSDPGTTVSSSNRHANFGFNVRYGTNNAIKGQSVFVFRGADGYDYVVKSNSWNGGGLAIGATTGGFSGRASVTVIDPRSGLPVVGLGGGNYTFRVDATQGAAATKTTPATPNTYAISVYNALGQLWHQAGTTTNQLPLGGGNIVVHPR